MPRLGSRTRDNYRMSLSGTQFPETPLKDPQSITDNHCQFEFDMYKHIYIVTLNKIPIENSTEIW